MSIFDAGKACTFSEMHLSLTYNGVPASGAKITRIVEWQSIKTDEFIADQQGALVLPEVLERSLTQLLPVEFVAAQALRVEFADQEFEIWVNSKRSPDKNSELGGQAINLTCELTSEQELTREFDTLLLTSCKW